MSSTQESLSISKVFLTVKPARHLPKVGLDDVVRGEGREVDGHCEHGEDRGDPEGEAAIGEEAEVVGIYVAAVGDGRRDHDSSGSGVQVRYLPLIWAKEELCYCIMQLLYCIVLIVLYSC